MRDAQKPDHISLQNLLANLRQGRYVIPDFQREFEWSSADIRDLLRSIFLDYYIGSLLIWKGTDANIEALSCKPIHGHEGQTAAEFIVLDGQQRLTALEYACLAPNANLPYRQNRYIFFIKVDKYYEEEYDEAFCSAPLTKSRKEFFEDDEQLYRWHHFPISILGRDILGMATWFRGYEEFWRGRVGQEGEENFRAVEFADMARRFANEAMELLGKYQVSYIELSRDIEIDKICDIFTKINSKGVKLDIFDLMNALLRPKDIKLKEMWHEVRPKFAFASSAKMDIYLLQVMSIWIQNYCSSKYLYFLIPGQQRLIRDAEGATSRVVQIQSPDDFVLHWKRAVAAMRDTLEVLRHPSEYGAIKADYIPYVSILPCLATIRAYVASLPGEHRMGAMRKVEHWYWSSVFLSRYSFSVETTAAKDYQDLCAWIQNDAAKPAVIDDFAARHRTIDLRRETRKGGSVYNGVFNLLIKAGARDWMTGAAPLPDSLDDHHIVPVSHAQSLGIEDTVHSILNRSPLSSDTNRNLIGAKLPNVYLPKLIALEGRTKVESIMATHLITPAALDILLREPFTASDFDAFLTERSNAISEAMESLMVEKPPELPADLKKIDEAIESVELGIRRLIDSKLEGRVDLLPSHVAARIDERIDRAIKKSAVMDPEQYDELIERLEYADLRELQDTIVNGSLWPLFAAGFGTREELAKRFDQLGDARNAIRHSRAVNEVTRRDGEASLAWFHGVLSKQVNRL